jgi:hypothetical protein
VASFWDNRILLPCITTWSVDWAAWIKDADRLGIKSIGLFLTGLILKDRPEIYKALEESKIESIPFVHLKQDTTLEEMDYLINRWGTKAFNIHTKREFPQTNDLSKYKDVIFVENTHSVFDEEEIKKWAGICIDVSHIEEAKIMFTDIAEPNMEIMKKYKIGCNHISPRKDNVATDSELKYAHVVEDLSEFDYLKNYGARFFGPIISLEVRNPLNEQLPMLKYIVELLNGKEEEK